MTETEAEVRASIPRADGVTVWTVGHSTHEIGTFTGILQAHGITTVADVRLYPGSRRFPQYRRDSLRASLADVEIAYVHVPGLGGRRPVRSNSRNTGWRNESFRGYADYMETPDFAFSMSALIGLARVERTALVCAEALWWRCHRSLIADCLLWRGASVIHILDRERTEPHAYTAPARIVDGRLTYEGEEQPRLC